MSGGKAERLLRGLAAADAVRVLRFRFSAWLAAAFLGWSLSLLAATLSLIGPVAYHSIVMAFAGSLPAFLFFPFDERLGFAALRRADTDAAAEAWLGAPTSAGSPASPALAKRAGVALEVGAMRGWKLSKPSAKARAALAALTGLGLAAFVAAQLVSLDSGYGFSIGYPDKASARAFERRDAVSAGRNLDAPDAGELEGAKAGDRAPPGSRRGGAGPDDPLADPRLGLAATGDEADQGASQTASDAGGNSAAEARTAAGRDAGSAKAASDGGTGAGSGLEGDGGRSGAEARSPGYKGSGKAMEASPLVDYRARFERQLVEATGVETALGDSPSTEVVSEAIAAWFSSFDASVSSGQAVDPELEAAGSAWLKAFGPGAER